MSNVQGQIDRIKNNIDAAYIALEALGVEVPEDATVDELAALINDAAAAHLDSVMDKRIVQTTGTATDAVMSQKATTEAVNDLKAQGVQQTPLTPEGETVEDQLAWLAENGDKTKVYLLADGYLYQYRKTEVEVDGGLKPNFTNLKDQTVFYYGQRYSLSGGAFKADASGTALVVPVPSGKTSIVLRLKSWTRRASYTAIYGGTTADAFTDELGITPTTADSDGVYSVTLSKASDITYIVFSATGAAESAFTDLIITVDEPIEYTTGSEIITTEAFVNTGYAFVPADYEDRIVALEAKSLNITKNTARIAELEGKVGVVDENAPLHNAVGATFPPSQRPASSEFDGYDIDALGSMADDLYAYIDEVVSSKETVTKEILGKDASGKYDFARYTYAKREHIAWQRDGYPKMYAWKNGSTVVYSTSVSPRIGDDVYETPYVGTPYEAVFGVDATNRARMVGDATTAFVRYESGDIEPTVIYTDKDDDRNGSASIVQDGITYNRYPLGDLGANHKKLVPVFVYANEHGITKDTTASNTYEDKLVALIAARMLRDLAAEKQTNNPLYKWMRENCMIVVIPVANPYGFNYNLTNDDNGNSGYYNANLVNINRNYDTPGWDVFKAENPTAATGAYPGSENETQYVMNTMVESGAVVAMSLHGFASSGGTCAHQGQNPGNVDYNQEKLSKISDFTSKNWGYSFVYYDSAPLQNTPDVTAKSPSYITQCGAYGGILEITSDDNRVSGLLQRANGHVCANAYAVVLNATAMWLSDYLDAQ